MAYPQHRHHQFGELLHYEEDELGDVCVYQRDSLRYLTFGNGVEQSCMNCELPHQLQHAYTEAMMLIWLLQKHTKQALLLGLGGAGIVRALRHVDADLSIVAVEYRQAVIDVAQQYFELADDSHTTLFCDDAAQFIQADSRQYDAIFADLYEADGVHKAQTEQDFISSCYHRLSNQGVLLVNLWATEFEGSQRSRDSLREIFKNRLLHLQAEGGNRITFAFKGDMPIIDRKRFFAEAHVLGKQMDIPLQKYAQSFWQQNARALQSRRFA